MNPADEYVRRVRAAEAEAAHLDVRHARVANLRLALVGVAIAVAWWSWQAEMPSLAWLLLLLIVIFIRVASWHTGIERRRDRARRAVDFYQRGLARIEDRWSGQGAPGERFANPHHPYATDLDLFGPDSLFALLSQARTHMGENRLADWLLAPASRDTIRSRHASITELRGLLDFREDLAVLGSSADINIRPEAMLTWAEAANRLTRPWIRWAAVLLPIVAVAMVFVWKIWGLISPFLLVLLIEVAVVRALQREVRAIFEGTKNAFGDLNLLAAFLARLEREPFAAPELRALAGRLASHDLRATASIARLATIDDFIGSRQHLILQVLDIPLMYSVNVALAAEKWRERHGRAVRSWLDVVGEFEALISLACYSHEHPADPFPEFVDGPASFQATLLGHPLIPSAACVRNDVDISGATRALIVSGSNMSGKSTLLRTVGINAVLAMAGAPVRAKRIRLTPLQVGANIRVSDSLREGISRFYAEITRLRELYEASARQPPLLFLLDEFLQGTNSKDRHIGAQGVVLSLLERGAIGLLSTHDLALTNIDWARDRVRNVHFQDDLRDGRMTFDFTLRDGVLTKSNGLELMRSIGLKV